MTQPHVITGSGVRIERKGRLPIRRWLVHNCIAHPLLGVARALAEVAERFHDRTAPEEPRLVVPRVNFTGDESGAAAVEAIVRSIPSTPCEPPPRRRRLARRR